MKPDSPSGQRVGPKQMKEGTPSKEETRGARGGKGGTQGCPQTSEIKTSNNAIFLKINTKIQDEQNTNILNKYKVSIVPC